MTEARGDLGAATPRRRRLPVPGPASLQSNFWERPGPAGAGWAEAPGGEAGG